MIKFFKSHSVLMTIAIVIVLFISLIATRGVKKPGTNEADNVKSVSLVDAATFRTDSQTVSADGNVQSSIQVDLRSQISAPVVAVNVSIGQLVSAGQVLVLLQSSDIAAQLEQAQANLALAEAQYSNAGISIDAARKSALDKISDAYVKVDDSIHTQVDQMFSNPTTQFPKLSFSMANQQLSVDIESERARLEGELTAWKSSLDKLSPTMSDTDLDAAIVLAKTNLSDTSNFLDKMSEALSHVVVTSQTISSALPGWKAAVTTARANISGASMAITGAEQALSSARAVVENPDASSNNPSTAQAQVQAAKAAVAGLKAQLAKTAIRSPISGKVSSLSVKLGDFVTPGLNVASVTNANALEVKAYVSDSDFSKIAAGAAATINGSAKGFVSNISPSINPDTKKVELKIVVNNPSSSGLVVGQSVHTEIIAKSSSGKSVYLVPIQNVKIVPGQASVYTVEDSKIKENPVILGAVKGDFIEVTQGLSDDMKIVSPVYELEAGDSVSVSE